MQENENLKKVRHIAKELEYVAAGIVFSCKKCGHVISENGICPKCGENLSEDSQVDFYQYFENAFGIEYICDSSLDYLGCKIFVALGGPSIWIDTSVKQVCLAWWGEHAETYVTSNVSDLIDEVFSEQYNSMR